MEFQGKCVLNRLSILKKTGGYEVCPIIKNVFTDSHMIISSFQKPGPEGPSVNS